LYVILTGQAAVYKPTPQGHQFISVIGAPGLFGEASFLTGSAKSADIVTTQACDVLCVPYPAEILDPILNQSMGHQMAKRFWIQNALSQSDFFKKIPADCLDALTFSGKVIQLQNEQILFKQNDPSLAAYLVVQGQIKIAQDGKIISTLGQGGFFGEISLTMTNGMRSASAFSVGATTLLEINRNDFYLLLSRNLFLAKEIQSLAFHRLNQDQMRS
jgi:CRP-like cAMP-binding protein